MSEHYCRFCKNLLKHTFIDLGKSPISNAFLSLEQLNQAEKFYPLHVHICEQCFLVQLEEFESPNEIFAQDYAYFSSYSESWLKHAENYTHSMIKRFGLSSASQVIEIASNDGYLLQYFQSKNIRTLGIEPAINVAKIAESKGIPTLVKFFDIQTATGLVKNGIKADLLLGNNVLAHVPNLNDFMAGMKIILKPQGIITMEFPHILQLIQQNQFDTIYHEHFSYFSFFALEKIFGYHGLTIFDVEELSTHGGSLRIYAKHSDNKEQSINKRVELLRYKESQAELDCLKAYLSFKEKVRITKRNFLNFLIQVKDQGKTIVGYGAPAKGNTFLNYCGIRTDFLDYTCDRSPHKQGKFLPGTHIPIYDPEKITETQPDFVLILPWNLKDEIIEQVAYIREWGGKFIVAIPKVEVIS